MPHYLRAVDEIFTPISQKATAIQYKKEKLKIFFCSHKARGKKKSLRGDVHKFLHNAFLIQLGEL